MYTYKSKLYYLISVMYSVPFSSIFYSKNKIYLKKTRFLSVNTITLFVIPQIIGTGSATKPSEESLSKNEIMITVARLTLTLLAVFRW
jgi:hypothetical protein